MIALTLASVDPGPPAAPDGDRWGWTRTVHALSDTLTCRPNGTFSITLRWRLHKGVESVTVTRQGKSLPTSGRARLLSALGGASDLNWVQVHCLGTRAATVDIAYVASDQGHWARKMLTAVIWPDRIELVGPRARDAD